MINAIKNNNQFLKFTYWASNGADTDFFSNADRGRNRCALTSPLIAVEKSEKPLYVSTITLDNKSGMGACSEITQKYRSIG